MRLEDEIQAHILKDCEKYYKKVTRVWSSFLAEYETHHGKVNAIFFENLFFKVLNDLIENKQIYSKGYISEQNMRMIEIGQARAK